MRISVLVILAALSSVQAQAKQQIWTDGNFYVYDEANSCALYVEYDDESLLRISYKGSTDQVFFGYFGPSFSRMPLGETLTIMFATEDDPANMLCYVATIINNGAYRGLAGSGNHRLLEHLQGADNLKIYGPLMVPLADLDSRGLDNAVRRARECGREK